MSVSPSRKMRRVENYDEVLSRLNSLSGFGDASNKATTSNKTLISVSARSTGAVATNQQIVN